MSRNRINPPLSASFLFFFLLFTPTTSFAPFFFFRSYSQYKSVVSLSHSLLIRVSNLRASRGDVAGANRAKLIAQKLEKGLGSGLWGFAWSVGWDYSKNFAWKELDYSELYGVVSDLNELARFLDQLTRAESEVERASWVARNYSNVEALKEVVETVQREVVDGGLLRDCLELGSNDLKGLVQIVKDLASQYYSTSNYNSEL